MKKIFILLIFIFLLLSGCTSVNDDTSTTTTTVENKNNVHLLKVGESTNFNNKIISLIDVRNSGLVRVSVDNIYCTIGNSNDALIGYQKVCNNVLIDIDDFHSSTVQADEWAKLSFGLPTQTCTDSDNGKDYDVKGFGDGWKSDTQFASFYDVCFNGYSQYNYVFIGGGRTNECHGDSCYLAEYYCDGKFVKNESYKCEYGCKYGACLKGKPDLTITDVVIEPENPKVGDQIKVYVHIKNNGIEEVDQAPVDIEIRNDKNWRQEPVIYSSQTYCLYKSKDDLCLEPNESKVFVFPTSEIDNIVISNEGTYYVRATVDSPDYPTMSNVDESDETNNELVKTVYISS